MKYRVCTLSLTCLAVLLESCSGRSLDSGESDYAGVAGTLTVVEAAPYKKVVQATVEAMQSLQLKPLLRDNDAFRAFIVGESVFGRISQTHEVRVWITQQEESKTKIEMRIIGRRDEDRLRSIHAEIRKRLGTSG